MTGETIAIEQSRREAERAKRRLASTMGALRYRLRPANLGASAWQAAKERGTAAADDAVTRVKEHPELATGVAAGLALFAARGPLISLASRLFGGGGRDPMMDTDKEGEAAPDAVLPTTQGVTG